MGTCAAGVLREKLSSMFYSHVFSLDGRRGYIHTRMLVSNRTKESIEKH
jgi:hypothetical protein